MTTELLAGLRIVEMTEVWAGPMGGSLLGDLGAEVVKLESFPRSSMTRPPGPAAEALAAPGEGPGYERYAIHQLANRNKRNVAINLREEGGIEAMRRLLARADVFFEGYSSGTVAGLGFGWDEVRAINPNIVMISMPGWGVEGPYSGYVTLGSGLDSAAGHTAVRGYPDQPFEDVGQIYHSDATGAVTLIFAIVTALRRREQTGEGCFIDLSQVEALAWQLPGLLAEWTMNGRVPERLGNRDPHVVPHGCYRAGGGELGEEDSWVVIAAEDDAQWRGVATAAGHPEWAEPDHPWATVVGRLRQRSEVDAAMAEYAASTTAEEAATAVQAAGGIAAPVIGPWSVLSSPQHAATGWLEHVTHPLAGEHIFPGFAWRVSPDAPSWDRYCGLLGEHNGEVLGELGYSEDEIAALLASGAIGDRYEA